ncbi:hypothetical protein V3N99_08455 [Dermatophilaceae bacterium Soc4.6]
MRPFRSRRTRRNSATTEVAARLLTALTVTALAAAALTSTAAADSGPSGVTSAPTVPPLPAGWTLTRTPGAPAELTWHASGPVRMGDAALEVKAGSTLLGRGRESSDLRSVSVTLPTGLDPATLSGADLSVSAGARRLDRVAITAGAAPGARQPASPLPAQGPPAAVDPGTPGSLPTASGEYALPGLQVPGIPAPVEVTALVVGPTVAAAGTSPRPLVLLLHGRHGTCYTTNGLDSGDWPCPAGWLPIPSYRGYQQTQDLLASQGYVTVSISANGINGQDFALTDGGASARSVLIRHHLEQWLRWSGAGRRLAPAAVRAVAPADLSRVLLVGHSRGGEGVNRAALDSITGPAPGWTIRGNVHIAPTDFGRNVAPGVPAVVLLPSCDGDVSDLQGQNYVDDGRDLAGSPGADPVLRTSLLVVGANHNFFNQEWTPGESAAPSFDDWYDGSGTRCDTSAADSVRLTPAAQRQVGATYVAAAAALLLRRDQQMLPLLDGTGTVPRSVGSTRVLTAALGQNRRPLVVPADPLPIVTSGATTAQVCRTDAPSSMATGCPVTGPSFGSFAYTPGEPSRRALRVSWTAQTGEVRITRRSPTNLSGAAALSMRVASDAPAAARFALRLTDTAGRAVTLPAVQVTSPLDGVVAKGWALEVRSPLTGPAVAASGINLRAVTRTDLLPRSPDGTIYLLDAWSWSPGTVSTAPVRLPRVDLGPLQVAEGDVSATLQVPLRLTGDVSAPARLWISLGPDPSSPRGRPTSRVVTIPAGATEVTVPVPVDGNTTFDPTRVRSLIAQTISGIVVGDYQGEVAVLDDDPPPRVTVTAIAPAVTEGSALRWRIAVAPAQPTTLYLPLTFAAVPGGAELSTADVPFDWLQSIGANVRPGMRPRPLSAAVPRFVVPLYAGVRTADIVIPISTDALTEGVESVHVVGDADPVTGLRFMSALDVTGTVTDAG